MSIGGIGGPGGPVVAVPSDGPFDPGSGDIPCDVATILRARCVECHGSTPRLGAPFSLTRASDFAQLREGASVAVRVMNRVQSDTMPMPPPPQVRLDVSEVATLQRWVDVGAAPTSGGCAVEVVGPGTAGSGASATPPTTTVVPQDGLTPTPPPDATPPAGNDGGETGDPTGASAAPGDWTMFGRDLSNSRSNPAETTLTPSNVGTLRPLWEFNGPGTTSTPAVVDGVIYLPGWDGKVRALRTEDGSELWSTSLPDLIDSSPMVTPTQIFVSDDAGSLHALARTSGALQWSVPLDSHPSTHLWSSPVYIADANLVVIGVASHDESAMTAMNTERNFRGSVVGVDAASGAERFRFYTTTDDAMSGSGVAVWATPAVDTTRKTLYVGTGNNYEAPTGELADSMLAINYESGALVWSRQFTAEDVFLVFQPMGPDFDIGSSANLFSAGGKDLVGIGSKSGTYFALDRDSGAIEWMQQVSPGGVLGGVISASAYSEGLVFVAGNDMAGGTTRTSALDTGAGGKVLWTHTGSMSTYGGLAHAGGVVYLGTTGGIIYAIDGATGAELWQDSLPDSIAGSPVISGGVLYVPWGYQWTLSNGQPGTGGLVAYGL